MAARDHFGPQLQFFIPAGAFEEAARDPKGKFMFTDVAPGYEEPLPESIDDLKELKLRKARSGENSLYKDIAKHGVRTPVVVEVDGDWRHLEEGHHRVFAAASVDPGMEIPVRYV